MIGALFCQVYNTLVSRRQLHQRRARLVRGAKREEGRPPLPPPSGLPPAARSSSISDASRRCPLRGDCEPCACDNEASALGRPIFRTAGTTALWN